MEVLGIMSGSSLDGLDLVLCTLDDNQYRLTKAKTRCLPDMLKKKLRELPGATLKDYLLCRKEYSDFVADCILEFTQDVKFDLIGLHGHTCFHLPEEGVSLQLSDGARISALTAHTVITDFRSGDIALGGVGTPLVPIFEQLYLSGYDYYLNLGGIANITQAKTLQAYDLCPCNQLLNFLAEKEGMDYDENGNIGRKGTLNQAFYQSLSTPEYYKLEAPKSIDNNWIKSYYFRLLDESPLSNSEHMHTTYQWITDLIIGSISQDESQVLVTGGGAHNDYLMSLLETKAEPRKIKVIKPEEELIDFKEAILMCVMAYRRYLKMPNILSSVTGAKIDNLGGAIYEVHG